ncbi:MAG: cupredoxin domain-containing protein [Candidatus Nitrosopumilus sp. bin_7KS]
MKTRLLIIIGIIGIAILLGIVVPNYWLEFDDYSIFLCERWFDSHYQCNTIWIDPQCNLPGSGCIFPKQTPFEQFLEKKATTVFNLKLDDYRIISEVHVAYPAYSTGLHKSFVTQAVEVNGSDVTRYYLSTTFIPDDSLDEIDVEIYKIISEKCDLSIISTGSECESKYLDTIEPKPRSSFGAWTNENSNKPTSTVTILRGAVIEENKALDTEVIVVVLGINNTVTWVNRDDVMHAFSSSYENNLWWTGLLKPGDSSSVTFNDTGIFSYHGTPGPWITGTVVVVPDNYDESSLPSSKDYDFEKIRMSNACSEKHSFCFGVFENGTQIMTQCDFPIHGCSPVYFDSYVEEENEN